MERIRMWLFPVVLALAWLTGFAYVLARLGEVHATLVVAQRQQQQQQQPEVEQPASDAQQLAKR
jgi:hypothetical protein